VVVAGLERPDWIGQGGSPMEETALSYWRGRDCAIQTPRSLPFQRFDLPTQIGHCWQVWGEAPSHSVWRGGAADRRISRHEAHDGNDAALQRRGGR